jgi:hypothetical protein
MYCLSAYGKEEQSQVSVQSFLSELSTVSEETTLTIIPDHDAASSETAKESTRAITDEVNNLQKSIIWDHVTRDMESSYHKVLDEKNHVQFPLNGTMCDISMEKSKREGAIYTGQFTILIEGIKEPYIINDYDATYYKFTTMDADGDGRQDIIVLFDTHGAGGNGTYDMHIITPKEYHIEGLIFSENVDIVAYQKTVSFTENKEIEITDGTGKTSFVLKMEDDSYDFLYDDRMLYKDQLGQSDTLRNYNLVNWNGEERLLIEQYFCGYDHASGIGVIQSILNMKEIPFSLEYQQIEIFPEYEDSITVYAYE